MAIKVSGNTAISDGRNVVAGTFNATNISANGASLSGVAPSTQIIPPVNVSPADGATDVSTLPTLQITNFEGVFDNTHANTQFQVSIDSGFSNTEVDTFTGAETSLTLSSQLSTVTQHFFRARFIDNNGCCSLFSSPTSFTTKTLPTDLGESVCGGFYAGTISAAGSCYVLIMAPNSTGCACCPWKTTRNDSGVGETGEALCDGYGNTYDHLANATHPAGNWTATRSIGGFDDWYLPSVCELNILYEFNEANEDGCHPCSLPGGEGFQSSPGCYWSSTEDVDDLDRAVSGQMAGGGAAFGPSDDDKTDSRALRAIRRLSL